MFLSVLIPVNHLVPATEAYLMDSGATRSLGALVQEFLKSLVRQTALNESVVNILGSG